MANLIEQMFPGIMSDGIQTNKNIVVGGSAGFDMSGSTGTFKTPTGAATLNGNVTIAGAGTFSSGTGAVTLSGPTTQKANLVSGSGATVTLTAAQSGSTVLFDRAAGIVFTLPAPAVGMWFEFVVTVSVTSNAHKVITDAGTTLLIGNVWNAVAAGTGTTFIANGSTHISVSQNGTTSGGLIGTSLLFQCVSSTLWNVSGTTLGSGTIVTPFATS